MNFLAHAYLSQGQPGIITGNLISDFVKGSKQYELPERVHYGIRLHRNIDQFTDGHECTQVVKSLFRKDYRLYAGAFSDIVYDHFLANDGNRFKQNADLESFTENVHQDLDNHLEILPENFLPVYRSMKQYGWLGHYGKDAAILKSFQSLVKRAVYMDHAERAFEIFLGNKNTILEAYEEFFPQLETFSQEKLLEMTDAR
jgi:acyl carrier protein phosphodiesterase